jgi:hypothetical protein
MNAQIVPQARFVTEQQAGPYKGSYRLIKDVFHAGHHPTNPLIRTDGVIEYERGAACIGMTPNGEIVLLSTTDRDDMELEHRFYRTSGEPMTARSEAEMEGIPSHELIAGKDVLGDGSIYLGRFIKQKPYGGNGDTNYDHILGVAAWKPTPKNLLHTILDLFSQHHRQDLLDSGLLMHHDPLVWTSKEMVYAAWPKTLRGFYGDTVHVTKKGEGLYTLYTLTSPRKGWNSARLFHEVFTAMDQKNMSGFKRPFMHLLFNSIAVKRKDMTMPEIENHIDETFSPTVKKLRQGDCPYTLENGYGEKVTGLRWAKGKLKQTFASVAFAIHDISKRELMTTVVLPSVAAFSVSALTESGKLAALAMAPSILLGVRLGFLLFSRSRPVFGNASFSDLIHHFWKDGVSRKNIPQQFEMVRPDVLGNLRVLPRREIDKMMRMPSNTPADTPLWDTLYMMGTMNGPYGSQASLYQIGSQWVLKTDEEKKSSGMQIEYWPLLNVAFAKNPVSDHLPQSLIDGFQKAGKPICMVYANRDKNGYVLDYGQEYLTQEEYDLIVEMLQDKPARDIYRQPEVTGKYLKDYPLEPIGQAQDPYQVSEWAKGAREGGALEVAAEILDAGIDALKNVLNGPH